MMIGSKITQPDDPLCKTTAEHICRMIQKPDHKLLQNIEHLRNLKTIDEKSYRNFKKNLPYFVCGIFHPPFRKKDNFASTQFLIADFDHLHTSSLNPDSLKSKLASDPRVMAAFTSPGGDGLKVLFKISEPCKDHGIYKILYSNFLHLFASDYNLLPHLDKVTHDVTRATFLSFDPHIHYNPNATPLEIQPFLSSQTTEATLTPIHLPTQIPDISTIQPEIKKNTDPDEQTLSYIKNFLRDKKNPPVQKIITPSGVVQNIIPLLNNFLSNLQCKITHQKTIHYGEQITISNGKSIMEFNIFHGKKGFSVVVNPRSGTNHQLASEFKSILEQALLSIPTNTSSS